ncbi:MAG: site-specific DNA-methyltransferase, partial [Chloroflexi bacterium]|nr:site-specific DNA-methyltransferase [Chloroflexota bacterium]
GTSTAWGSWLSASNPSLRDTHEYILIFQKPPFGRPRHEGQESTIKKEQFLEWTRSVWAFGPQSAKQAGHPAPFPPELPHRLMQLYTYDGEVVLDPFMGSGATAIAAVRSGRRYVGYDLSAEYLARAAERVAAAVEGSSAGR